MRRALAHLSTPAVAAVALGLTAAAVVVLWVWVGKLNDRIDLERKGHLIDARALQLFAEPTSKHVPVAGRTGGGLAVAPSGRAVLVLLGLAAPPPTRLYEAWIVTGSRARRAGVFSTGGPRTVIPLTHHVPPGARVVVTIEPASGSKHLTKRPIIWSRAV